MEKNQAETNKRLDKRLDDVMNSNLTLQNMIASVLNNLSGKDTGKSVQAKVAPNQLAGGTSADGFAENCNAKSASSGSGKSEKWWDENCGSSEDDKGTSEEQGRESYITKRRQNQVNLFFMRNRHLYITELVL